MSQNQSQLLRRIEALEASFRRLTASTSTSAPVASASSTTQSSTAGPTIAFVNPTEIASGSGRSDVDWTPVDLGSLVPSGTSIVLLFIEALDTGDPAVNASIELRADANAVTVIGCRTELIDYADVDVNVSAQAFVPLTGGRSMQYRVVGGYQNYWKISLQGYLTPGN